MTDRASMAPYNFPACRRSQDGPLFLQRWVELACCSTGQQIDTSLVQHCRKANAGLLSFASSAPCARRLQIAETCIALPAFSLLSVGGLTRSHRTYMKSCASFKCAFVSGRTHLCKAAGFAGFVAHSNNNDYAFGHVLQTQSLPECKTFSVTKFELQMHHTF